MPLVPRAPSAPRVRNRFSQTGLHQTGATFGSPLGQTGPLLGGAVQTGLHQTGSTFPRVPRAPGLTPPGAPTGAGGQPWLDPTYLNAVGQLQYNATNQINSLGQQDAYANTDYQTALQRMAQAQPDITRNLNISANRQGLAYSGTLAHNLANADETYQHQVQDAGENFTRSRAARVAAINQILGQQPYQETALQQEALQRYIAAQLARRALLPTTPAVPPRRPPHPTRHPAPGRGR